MIRSLPHGECHRTVASEHDNADRSYLDNEAPAAAPVANVGNNPTGSAAPPNLGHEEHGGAAGETEAAYPIGDTRERHEGEPRSR